MNTEKEIREFIDNIDCGEPIYNITTDFSGDLKLDLPEFVAKKQMYASNNWLEKTVSYSLRRKFNKETKKVVIADKDMLFDDFCQEILSAVVDVAKAVSPATKPKRTKAYQEIVFIARKNKLNEKWLDDVLPILNYYFNNKTDSTVQKNVYGLFNILRKRYDTGS